MLTLLTMLSLALAEPPPPSVGVGLLFQGIRPGGVVEYVRPLAHVEKKNSRTMTHMVVPTFSGWVQPGNYVPLQLHAHYAFQEKGPKGVFFEGAVGLGTTWVINARPTFKLEDGELKRLPLAGAAVFSPGIGLGVGKAGERRDVLFRGRLNVWVPWQHVVAPSWNLELVVRFKKEAKEQTP